VLIGVLFPARKLSKIWISLVAALIGGFVTAIYGALVRNQDLVQASGAISMVIPAIFAVVISISKNRENDKCHILILIRHLLFDGTR
jgi:uncharacterized membrane protein YjjB (DUF3815 family)